MSLERGEWMLPVITTCCRRVLLCTHIYTLPRGFFCRRQLLLESSLSQPACYWARTDNLGSRLRIRYDAVLCKEFGEHNSRCCFRSANRVVQNLVVGCVQSTFWCSLCTTDILRLFYCGAKSIQDIFHVLSVVCAACVG